MKKMCIVLLVSMSSNAYAVCETEYNNWKSHRNSYNIACGAGAVGSIAGTLLTLPAFGIGGLWAGAVCAGEARKYDILAKDWEQKYNKCMEKDAADTAQRIQDEKDRADKSATEEKILTKALKKAFKERKSNRDFLVNDAKEYSEMKIQRFINQLIADGQDVTDPAVKEYIKFKSDPVKELLKEYIERVNNHYEADIESIKHVRVNDLWRICENPNSSFYNKWRVNKAIYKANPQFEITITR